MLNVNLVEKENGTWIRVAVGNTYVELATSESQCVEIPKKAIAQSSEVFVFNKDPARTPSMYSPALMPMAPVFGQIVQIHEVVPGTLENLLGACELLFGLKVSQLTTDWQLREDNQFALMPVAWAYPEVATYINFGYFYLGFNSANKITATIEWPHRDPVEVNNVTLRQLGFSEDQIAKPFEILLGEYNQNLTTVKYAGWIFFNVAFTDTPEVMANLPGLFGEFDFTPPLKSTMLSVTGEPPQEYQLGVMGTYQIQSLTSGKAIVVGVPWRD